MSVVVYPALVAPAPSGDLHGRFLDFSTLEFSASGSIELIRVAREALAAELLRLEAGGDIWPEPTALQLLQVPMGSSAMLVDVSVDDAPIRLTISLGERLLKRIDQDAEARSMTRSGYLALGARRLLAGGPASADGEAAGARSRQSLQDEIAEFGRRVTETLGPHSAVGRTLADLDAMALDGLRRLGEEVRATVKSRSSRASAVPPDRQAKPDRDQNTA